MRTALLAAVKRTENGDLRAFLPLAGRSVLGWQADLSRLLGCERIICLSDELSPEILRLQHESEAAGHEFYTVRTNAQIASLVRTGDEVLVICDGVVIGSKLVDSLAASNKGMSPTVYCLKSDDAIASSSPADFERIDVEHAWAGLLVVRVEALQSLAEMPADSDPVSSLVRLALQSGANRIEIEPRHLLDDELLLADNPDRLTARGRHLIDDAAPPIIWSGPGLASARLLGRWIELAGVPLGFGVGAAIGLLTLVGATAFAWAGFGTAGLGLAALGSFVATCAGSVQHLRSKLFRLATRSRSHAISQIAFATLPLLTVIGALTPTLDTLALAMTPVLSFGLVAIASDDAGPKMGAFWSDRALHLVGLAIASSIGVLAESVALLGIAALCHKLLRMRRN